MKNVKISRIGSYPDYKHKLYMIFYVFIIILQNTPPNFIETQICKQNI